MRVSYQFKEDCMHPSISLRRRAIAIALAAALLTWPAAGYAQLGGILPPPPTTTTGGVVGNASAVQATVLGMTTVLSGTGPIGNNDALDASVLTGGVPSTLTAETLSATAIRSEEHTSELQSRFDLVCRLLLEE